MRTSEVTVTANDPRTQILKIIINRDPGSIPGSGRSPGEGSGNLVQYPCMENPMTDFQRSLAGYSQSMRSQSDTTEQLTFTFSPWGLASWQMPIIPSF